MMSTKDVFIRFYPDLVHALPLHNTSFLAKLYSNKLLTDDLMDRVKAKVIRADKAAQFLDEKIRTDINIGDYRSFEELLEIMQRSGDKAIRHLAKRIKKCLPSIRPTG